MLSSGELPVLSSDSEPLSAKISSFLPYRASRSMHWLEKGAIQAWRVGIGTRY